MSRIPAPPEGFVAESRGRATLIAPSGRRDALERAGLHRPEGWQGRIGEEATRPGRGATAAVDIGGGKLLRLKQLRRGGLTAGLWRERFPGPGRLMENLRIPLEAVRRGVPTPLPVALLMLEGPPGLYRGWLGLEEITDAIDLRTLFRSERQQAVEALGPALRAVRRTHDLGLDHRDLNLGNLLLSGDLGRAPRAWVIDLDAARLLPEPVAFAARQRALRRLERSYVKACDPGETTEEIRDAFYALYAADDETLRRRLERGRRIGRGWISIHRLGWRR